jgi:hypothetical protein
MASWTVERSFVSPDCGVQNVQVEAILSASGFSAIGWLNRDERQRGR